MQRISAVIFSPESVHPEACINGFSHNQPNNLASELSLLTLFSSTKSGIRLKFPKITGNQHRAGGCSIARQWESRWG